MLLCGCSQDLFFSSLVKRSLPPREGLMTRKILTAMTTAFVNALLGFLSLQNNYTSLWYRAVASIVHQYSDSIHVFVLNPDLNITDYLTSVSIPIVLNASFTDHQNQARLYVVFCNEVASVNALLLDKNVTLVRSIPWVVASPDSTNEALHEMFEQFFNRGILDVVSVHPSDSAVHVFTYFPFTREVCYNFKPTLIAKLVSRNVTCPLNAYPKNKVQKLFNCSADVLLFPVPPEILYPSKNESFFSPKMAELVHIMFDRIMNLFPEYSLQRNKSAGIRLLLGTPRLLSLGLPSVNPNVDHAKGMVARCITWCIPTNFDAESHTNPLAQSFSKQLWTACAVTVTAVTGTTFLLFWLSKLYSSSWMFVLSVVIGSPAVVHSNVDNVRFFHFNLYMSFLVINTIFKARLHSLMATSPRPSRMTEAVEVYKSDLNLFYPDNVVDWLNDSIGNITIAAGRLAKYDRSSPKSMSKVYAGLKTGKAAMFVNSEFCRIVAKGMGKTRGGYYKVYHLPSCIGYTFASYFGFSWESPFAERVKEVTGILREHGLSERLLKTRMPKETHSPVPTAIDMSDIFIVTLLWIAGLVFGLIVFVFEYLAGS